MMLERHQIIDLMGQLKLAGMRHAYEEVLAHGIRRQHPHQHVVGELLTAEVADKHARSIKYQMTASKLPLAKDIAGFEFADTPINEGLVNDLATGAFLASRRNIVLVGGTGSGKTHLAIAIARSCIRGGAWVRFYNTTDLVNLLELEPTRIAPENSPSTCRGSTCWSSTSSATCRSRCLAGSCCSTSSASSTSRPRSSSPPTSRSASGRPCSATPR